MEIALLLVALAVVVLAVTALGRAARRPRAAAADRGRGRGVVPARACPRSTSSPRSCCSGCCRRCCTPRRSRRSLVDFNANRRPILLLSVGLVVFTTVGVGVARARAAARASPGRRRSRSARSSRRRTRSRRPRSARRIGLPRRIVTILEGESLLNDATALVALRTAIARRRRQRRRVLRRRRWTSCVAAGRRRRWSASLVVRRWSAGLRKRVTDPVLDTAISFVVPFAAYIAAEEIHASGVIAVVVAGLLLGHKAPILQTAPVADRGADELAHHRLRPREHRLPADRPAGRAGSSRTSRTAASRPAGSSSVCAATLVARRRAAAGLGVPGPLPAGAARPGPRHRHGTRRGRTRSARLGRACAAWSRWPRRS